MRWHMSFFTCLLCTLRGLDEKREGDTAEKFSHLQIRVTACNPLNTVAALLLAFDPAACWQASTARPLCARIFTDNGCKLLAAVPRASVSSATASTSNRIIPRKLLFGAKQYASAVLSPDGKLLAYESATDAGGQIQPRIWCRTVGKRDDRIVSAGSYGGGATDLRWAQDSKTLLFLNDPGGTEDSHLYAIDTTQNASVVRDLSPAELFAGNLTLRNLRTNARFRDQVVIELSNKFSDRSDVYRCDLASDKCVLDTKNPGDIDGWFIDDESFEVRTAIVERRTSTTVRVRDSAESDWHDLVTFGDGTLPYEETDLPQKPFFEQFNFLAIAKDRKSVLALSSLGRDTKALVRLDTESSEELEVIASHDRCDVESYKIDEDSKVRMVSFNFARREDVFFDKDMQVDFRKLQEAGPEGAEVSIASETQDKQTWLVLYERDDGPGEYAIYERTTGALSKLFVSAPAMSEYKFARMEDVRIKARDGLELVAYLTRADATKATPLVLLVHGGPWARDSWGFQAEVQWLANRGYAVLQVNFRGSTGYGKSFEQKSYGEWGGNMQHDLSDAVAWAIREGVALADKICIFGASYGGYASLAGLAFTPGLYACGVDKMGISNVQTTAVASCSALDDAKVVEGVLHKLGNVVNDTEYNRKISPLFHVDDMIAPLFIAQGVNDPRVLQREADQIAFSMKARKLPVEYVLYLGEGHDIRLEPNRFDFYGRAEQFLAEHLGGRAEPFETPEGSSAIFPLKAAVDHEGALPDINQIPDPTGRLRIHYAASNGQLSEVALVGAASPATIKMQDQYGRLPVHYAATYGHTAVVKHLSAAAPETAMIPDEYSRLPIHYAAENGFVSVVECLGRAAPDCMKARAGMGRVPIHFAAFHGHAAVVEHLAAAAPETVAIRAEDDYLPIGYAANSGHQAVVKLLEKASGAQGLSTTKKSKQKLKKKKKGAGQKGFR